MPDHINQFWYTPWLQHHIWRKEPANALRIEILETYIEHKQGQHKIGYGNAHESNKCENVIANRVLAYSRIDADRQCDYPDEYDGGEGDDHRDQHAVTDHLTHRPVVLHGHAEVAAQHQIHPFVVLNIDRPVQIHIAGAMLRFPSLITVPVADRVAI